MNNADMKQSISGDIPTSGFTGNIPIGGDIHTGYLTGNIPSGGVPVIKSRSRTSHEEIKKEKKL